MWVRGEKGSLNKEHAGVGFPGMRLTAQLQKKTPLCHPPKIWLQLRCRGLVSMPLHTHAVAFSSLLPPALELGVTAESPEALAWYIQCISCSSGSLPFLSQPGL